MKIALTFYTTQELIEAYESQKELCKYVKSYKETIRLRDIEAELAKRGLGCVTNLKRY